MTQPTLRHALYFSVLFCLLGSCSNTPPAPDAGTSSAAIGAGCSKDADCGVGAQCMTDLMGGYCTMSCSGAAACPASAICGTILGAAACELACSSAADCTRTGYTCDPTTGGCLPKCGSDNDCGTGQYCNSGQCVTGCDQDSDCNSGWYCNTGNNLCSPGCDQDSQCASGSCDMTTNQCAMVVVDAGTDGGMTASTDGGSSDAGATDAGSADAGSSDAGSSDAGSADAGSADAGSDGGGTCAGYAEPGQSAACRCAATDGGCAANNCYGGYYCDLSDMKCVTPPATCGTEATDAGEDAGIFFDGGIFFDAGSACPGYAEPDESAGCTCAATDGGCATNNCYGGWYCDLTDMKCVAPPSSCGAATDAGSSDEDAGLCPGYAPPDQTADCYCDSTKHSCNANGCYGTYYCKISDGKCEPKPSGC